MKNGVAKTTARATFSTASREEGMPRQKIALEKEGGS
jgi:hypothetical protein